MPIFDQDCPTRKMLDLIANRWTVLVVHALAGKARRYGQLKGRIGGISHKMLAQTLRQLETDGIVSRTVYPEVPPAVEYELTPLGMTLLPVLEALCLWADQHIDEVEAYRHREPTAIR